MTILFIRKNDESSVAVGVALFITAGYWFTSSTSFANTAVTTARVLSDTFGLAYFAFAKTVSQDIRIIREESLSILMVILQKI